MKLAKFIETEFIANIWTLNLQSINKKFNYEVILS
jgi:hypothetical protein